MSVFCFNWLSCHKSRGALWTFFLVVSGFCDLVASRLRALVNLALSLSDRVVFWGPPERSVCGLSGRERRG